MAWSGWGLLRSAFRQAMDAVPEHLDRDQVQAFLEQWPGVQAVPPLHIGPIGAAEKRLLAELKKVL